MLVLDSGGVSRLAERSREALALILAFREEGFGLRESPRLSLPNVFRDTLVEMQTPIGS